MKKKTEKTVSDLYWDELIEECKKENNLVRDSIIMESFIKWFLLLTVVLLIVVMFLK